ncbi:Uncharacterised protein [Mycobacteroides abscessus subsp. abscessus]|nr:Uncharacterised protein [Mycobacteroides abscessus subsp. abscessus]
MRQPGGTQHRTGYTQGHTPGEVQIPNALGAGLPDVVLVQQVFHIAQPAGQDLEQVPDLLLGTVGQILREPTGPHIGVIHTQAGDRLEDLQDHFAFAETEEHGRHRPELHAPGGQRDQV